MSHLPYITWEGRYFMNKTFEINGNKYIAKEFGFNMMCDLEANGVSIEDANKKPMSLLRVYFALCANESVEFAGNEMEQHIINGGKFDELGDVMSEMMDKSGFFRALSKTEEEETTTSKSQKK